MSMCFPWPRDYFSRSISVYVLSLHIYIKKIYRCTYIPHIIYYIKKSENEKKGILINWFLHLCFYTVFLFRVFMYEQEDEMLKTPRNHYILN